MLLRNWLLWVFSAVLVAVQFAYVFRAAVSTQTVGKPPLLECVQSGKGGKPVGSDRDCTMGQGSECTRSQPCTPCSSGGCTSCSTSTAAFAAGTAQTGECSFLEGVGPYCRDEVTGAVSACTSCCST